MSFARTGAIRFARGRAHGSRPPARKRRRGPLAYGDRLRATTDELMHDIAELSGAEHVDSLA